eukprot:7384600-Prymnesium_polylepis.1
MTQRNTLSVQALPHKRTTIIHTLPQRSTYGTRMDDGLSLSLSLNQLYMGWRQAGWPGHNPGHVRCTSKHQTARLRRLHLRELGRRDERRLVVPRRGIDVGRAIVLVVLECTEDQSRVAK